jgi:hypothetical protein
LSREISWTTLSIEFLEGVRSLKGVGLEAVKVVER